MTGKFVLHHVGVAVRDLEEAAAFYAKSFGLKVVAGPIEDPIQRVKACYVGNSPSPETCIELICPLDATSPVNGYLSKGIGAYHVCLEVPGLADVLEHLREQGCVVISGPVPAIAYGGRRIAWCFTPTRQLIELLEAGGPPPEPQAPGRP